MQLPIPDPATPRPLPQSRLRAAARLTALLVVTALAAAPAAAQPTDGLSPNPLCDTDPGLLCLLGGRFEAWVEWKDQHNDREGLGVREKLTDRSGTFWFFHPDNVELIVKMLDGRPVNGDFWVFVGAMTDVEFFLTVRDRETGFLRTYHNPPGRVLGIADTDFSAGTEGALCGTIAGIGCDDGFFCDVEAGLCSGADLAGTCVLQSDACPPVIDPVCGCDGVTYGSDCDRVRDGVQKDHHGPCGGGEEGDDVATALVLAVGDSGRLGGLTITLLGISQDSRCPSDVTCVWEGDAVARLRAQGEGIDETFDLHLTLAPRSKLVGGARVVFRALAPEPLANDPIPASAYRATFVLGGA